MPTRSQYWSCTKFADWLRGTNKPSAETSSGWNRWNTEAKTKHPIRYWIVEEGLDKVQDFIWWPVDKLYSVKYYINNRYISRTHSLTAHSRDIKPGQWCDVGNRFLPCLFNELVDFVEVELAWWHLAWEGKEVRKKYNAPWWRFGWWNVRLWRCPQAGLDNLKWQSELVWKEEECEPGSPNIGKPTYQAEKAKEMLELYKWWTEIYPNRPDPHDVSGWSELCSRERKENGNAFGILDSENRTPELQAEITKSLDLSYEIEDRYRKEDEEMMIRLIKIRESLWT